MDMQGSFVCISSLLLMHEAVGQYCQAVLQLDDSASIVNVCQTNKATGSIIHLDSTGAPVGDEILCTCDLTHNKGTDKQLVYITTISNTIEGITFEINNMTFQHNTRSITVYLETRSSIIFRQTSGVQSARICLHLSAIPKPDNITIGCNPEQKRPDSTSKEPLHQSKAISTISTLGNDDDLIKSTLTVSDITDVPTPTTIPEHAQDKDVDTNSNAGIAGGTSSAGVILVIMTVVVVVVVRQRRTRNDKKGTEKEDNTARYVNTRVRVTHVTASDKSLVNIRSTKDNTIGVEAVDNGYECPGLPSEYEIMENSHVIMDNDNAEAHCYENQHMATSRNVYELLDKNKSSDANYESLKPV